MPFILYFNTVFRLDTGNGEKELRVFQRCLYITNKFIATKLSPIDMPFRNDLYEIYCTMNVSLKTKTSIRYILNGNWKCAKN